MSEPLGRGSCWLTDQCGAYDAVFAESRERGRPARIVVQASSLQFNGWKPLPPWKRFPAASALAQPVPEQRAAPWAGGTPALPSVSSSSAVHGTLSRAHETKTHTGLIPVSATFGCC